MAQPDKAIDRHQKQAEHFQEIKDDATEVLNDPDSTQEDKDEAQETIDDMDKNLARLEEKFNVTPTG
jgi:predicted nuclease with TOPRIM domain